MGHAVPSARGIRFTYRPWFVLPKRAIELESSRPVLVRGAIWATLRDDARNRGVIALPPRYNRVADVSTRVRAGCHAHLRRYFVDAKCPDAQPAIDLVGELYAVEHEAARRSLRGNSKLEFRKLQSAPIRDRLMRWLDDNAPKHPPRSPMGKAFTYARNSWEALGRFLDDAALPLDNNASEAALRRVALGRKNYLFVGDVDAGDNIGVLYTLIATCEARGINPFACLTDVLERVAGEPVDEPQLVVPGDADRPQADQALDRAFLLLTSRRPDDDERAILRRMHADQPRTRPAGQTKAHGRPPLIRSRAVAIRVINCCAVGATR
jgi:transposase